MLRLHIQALGLPALMPEGSWHRPQGLLQAVALTAWPSPPSLPLLFESGPRCMPPCVYIAQSLARSQNFGMTQKLLMSPAAVK